MSVNPYYNLAILALGFLVAISIFHDASAQDNGLIWVGERPLDLDRTDRIKCDEFKYHMEIREKRDEGTRLISVKREKVPLNAIMRKQLEQLFSQFRWTERIDYSCGRDAIANEQHGGGSNDFSGQLRIMVVGTHWDVSQFAQKECEQHGGFYGHSTAREAIIALDEVNILGPQSIGNCSMDSGLTESPSGQLSNGQEQ